MMDLSAVMTSLGLVEVGLKAAERRRCNLLLLVPTYRMAIAGSRPECPFQMTCALLVVAPAAALYVLLPAALILGDSLEAAD